MFRWEGNYKLNFATAAEEAPSVLESDGHVELLLVDILLVDISLGSGPNGADLLREVKAREDIEDVPAIALTAYAMPGDREELLDEGFEECRQRDYSSQLLEIGR